MVLKEGRELPSIPVLGNSHGIGDVFTGLCGIPVAVLLQHQQYLHALTELVPSGSYQLCSLDTS